MHTIHIRNMVCNRCKAAVRQVLETAGLPPADIQLGQVQLAAPPTPAQEAALRQSLQAAGFELLDDKRRQLIERIKTAVIEWVHSPAPDKPRTNTSDYLADRLGRDYGMLSSLFSDVEGTTIEKYIIAQKIERAKELLLYDELTLSQIADLLHYSSVQHLSNQFRKTTGLTPSHFKRIRENKRTPLDEV